MARKTSAAEKEFAHGEEERVQSMEEPHQEAEVMGADPHRLYHHRSRSGNRSWDIKGSWRRRVEEQQFANPDWGR